MKEEPASAFARQQFLFFGAQIGEKLRPEKNAIPWARQQTPKSAFAQSAAPCRIFVAGKSREPAVIGRNPQTYAEIFANACDPGHFDGYAVSC